MRAFRFLVTFSSEPLNSEDVVSILPFGEALCFVNGDRVTERTALRSGDRIMLGKCHIFRFNHPGQGGTPFTLKHSQSMSFQPGRLRRKSHQEPKRPHLPDQSTGGLRRMSC